ncbi:MAG: helix-turn-helix domain-containing protein [Terracidiphilus sp.]|jgi:TetR/AcrR family transcriptional regulator
MTVAPPTRSQTERADHTRARILEAAIRQFSENGLAGARTERIAEAAGVNKALLYYYFSSKEALYSAAIEAVARGVQAATMAVLGTDASAGERFLSMALNHFDRVYSNPGFSNLMQQEMVRLHRGEENALALLAEKLFGPLWLRVREVVELGIQEGELIPVDWMQMLYAGLGANVFYFLSAPLIGLALGFQPLDRSALAFRRKAAIEYLGQTIFSDRRHGAQVAERILAAAPMPPAAGAGMGSAGAAGIQTNEFKTDEARHA